MEDVILVLKFYLLFLAATFIAFWLNGGFKSKEYQDYAKYCEQKKQECKDKLKQNFKEIKKLIKEDK